MLLHLVILSGGMDSATLLHKVSQEMAITDKLVAMSFNYGQRHVRELNSARALAKDVADQHYIVPLVIPVPSSSVLMDHGAPMPHGHYAAESMKKTVVPGRNTLMLANALSAAEALIGEGENDAGTIYYGAHAGDHFIYPDCRPNYMRHIDRAFLAATDARIGLEAPFINQTKGEILAYGLGALNLPVEVYGNTWTCYEGGDKPCGQCGACVERAEAFAFAGAADPLLA